MTTCEKCGSEPTYDAAGRLDFGELPAALAESVRRSLDPTLEAFQQLLRVASPVRPVPSTRANTTRIVFPSTDLSVGLAGRLLVPAEAARVRLTIIACNLPFVGGVATSPQLVDLYMNDAQIGSQTAGFPISTGGGSAASTSNGTSIPAPLQLAYAGPVFAQMRAQLADPNAGPVLVAAISEYADLDPNA